MYDNKIREFGFVSMIEQIDTTTPAGTFVFHILAGVAESERQTTVERVRGGLRNATAKGKRLGRPTKPVDVDQINSLRASGYSWRSIASVMKLSVGIVYTAARSQHAKAYRLPVSFCPSN
jgi:DNA invertase Pin-like site-specific DNA recombinase